MTDGFLALDENLYYTYANKQVSRLVGMETSKLIGRHIWDVFPDAVGSATYHAIETAFKEKRYVCNEDFYAPLQLWQENRVYPSGGGISMFIRDITKQKQEEHHLKLLESVITNTTDAVLITEAHPLDEPGPRIVYVNDAFTRLTGYTAQEVIGKTPRILQGPKTDAQELKRLSLSLRKWQPCEVNMVNYKKSGEEFWMNFTVSPVADEKGRYTHWICIARDVTQRKNEELQHVLLSDISMIFNEPLELTPLLDKLLLRIANFGSFCMGEVWLIGADKSRITLAAHLSRSYQMKTFYRQTSNVTSLIKGEGLPGVAWAKQTIQVWDNLHEREDFLRREAAKAAGLKMAYAIPLISDNITIGVLLLGLDSNKPPCNNMLRLFDTFSTHFGAEIKGKQLKQELNQVFNCAPDILCIIGTDHCFKKVNPAMSALLGYTEEELLSRKITDLLHPDELETSLKRLQSFMEHKQTKYFENRLVTKAGKVLWISWTASNADVEHLIFAVGKNISDKKELERMLGKVTNVAQIGGWEIDLVNKRLYWSDLTKQIHEVAPDFNPGLEDAKNFYKEGPGRDLVFKKINEAILQGTSFDLELQILTAAGNTKWVRIVGEPEFADGQCVKLYGSMQNVDERVKAQINAKASLEERNVILESIGDAFFAIDKSWIVNYWNNMAEKVLGIPKSEILQRSLLEVFPDIIGSEFYTRYHTALQTGMPAHFEDYYPRLKAWYEISAYPSANGLSVFFKDITERKRTEELLMHSEQRYSKLFELSPMPKWVFDVHSLCFLDVNQAAIDHYGYSREEFLAMTIRDIRPPEDLPGLDTILELHNTQPEFKVPGIIRHVKKDGELIMVDIKSNNIQYYGKEARIIVANDITARLNYISAIEQQNEKLKEISWLQSHVIRAPLARIMGLLPMLDDARENEASRKEIVEYLKVSALELDEVIKNITQKTALVNVSNN